MLNSPLFRYVLNHLSCLSDDELQGLDISSGIQAIRSVDASTDEKQKLVNLLSSIQKDSLAHYGVKGMKWGVRRYQNEDGSLTPAGIKRYAEKGYKQDVAKSHRTGAGRIYGKVTDSDKYEAQYRYASSSKKANKQRAEKYLKEQKKNKSKTPQEAAAKAAVKGAKIVSKLALSSAVDDVFYGGAGKEALKFLTRRTVSAVLQAHGHDDIQWYDRKTGERYVI